MAQLGAWPLSRIVFGAFGLLCIGALIVVSTRISGPRNTNRQSADPPKSGAQQPLRGAGGTELAALVSAYKGLLPGQDSNAFVQPGAGDLSRFQGAIRLALEGKLSEAGEQLAPLGYDVAESREPTGGQYLVVRERAPCQRCWGLFILNRSATARDILIEVPHPLWDQFTPEMGIEAYQRLDAKAFLMAGAHRYANGQDSPVSDMARNPRSAFQTMHELLTGRDSQVLQYHGFDESDRRDYPDVVLSDGSSRPHPGLLALKSAIEARGARAGVYDGRLFADLGATDNPQGQQSRSIGARFYHMEYDYAVRKDPGRQSAMIEAAYDTLVARQAQ